MLGQLRVDPAWSLRINDGRLERGSPAIGGFGLRLVLHGLVGGADNKTTEQHTFDLDGIDVFAFPHDSNSDSTFLAEFRPSTWEPVLVPPQLSEWSGSFEVVLASHQLVKLEELRDKQDLRLKIVPRARAFIGARRVHVSIETNYGTMAIPRSQWSDLLAEIGFQDFLSVELPIPAWVADARYETAYEHLRRAMEFRARGDHDKAVSECRNTLDKMTREGFGGHAPKDVYDFIKQRSRAMSMCERASVLQAALEIYCAPAAHGDDHFKRADSTLAIAIGASLLRLDPNRLACPKEVAPDSVPSPTQ